MKYPVPNTTANSASPRHCAVLDADGLSLMVRVYRRAPSRVERSHEAFRPALPE
jgi:hypothetical protein